MSTTSFPLAAWLPMVPDGSILRPRFFLPVRHFAAASAAGSGQGFMDCSNTKGSSSMARCSSLLTWHIQPLPLATRPEGLGGLRQATLRRRRTCSRYLARYTHRVAISNHRLVAFGSDRVSFRWPDYAHGGKQKFMTFPRMSSCDASCSTFCPRAWCASDTSDSSPTAGEVLHSNVAALYSA